MEDTHICHMIELPGNRKDQQGMLFVVFDGHGGKEVAEFLEQNFKNALISSKSFKTKEYDKALANPAPTIKGPLRPGPFV